MKTGLYFVAVAFLVVAGVSDACGGKGGKGKGKKMECKGEKMDMEAMMPTMKECKSKAEEDEQEDKKVQWRKMQVCIMEKENAVADNSVSESGFKALFKKMLPENGEDLGNYVYEACVTNEPSNVQNLSQDDNYASYEALNKCIMKKWKQFCKKEE